MSRVADGWKTLHTSAVEKLSDRTGLWEQDREQLLSVARWISVDGINSLAMYSWRRGVGQEAAIAEALPQYFVPQRHDLIVQRLDERRLDVHLLFFALTSLLELLDEYLLAVSTLRRGFTVQFELSRVLV